MDGKAIFNSYTAKQLLKLGNIIVDLQPDKKREGATIFYFSKTNKLLEDLENLSHNNLNVK